MARKATGLPLTFRPLRLDDEVWAAIQKLKETNKTINAGLRIALLERPIRPPRPRKNTHSQFEGSEPPGSWLSIRKALLKAQRRENDKL